MPYLYNGQTYGDDAIISINDINYALRRQSPEKLQALGVTKVAPPAPIDERYYQRIGDVVSERPWEELKAQLLAYSAAMRWEKEIGGIMVGETPIQTDQRTQSVLTAAWATAKFDSNYEIANWKVGNVYITLSNAQIIAIAEAVRAHVAACFTLNKTVDAAIEAQEITTYEGVDQAYLNA